MPFVVDFTDKSLWKIPFQWHHVGDVLASRSVSGSLRERLFARLDDGVVAWWSSLLYYFRCFACHKISSVSRFEHQSQWSAQPARRGCSSCCREGGASLFFSYQFLRRSCFPSLAIYVSSSNGFAAMLFLVQQAAGLELRWHPKHLTELQPTVDLSKLMSHRTALSQNFLAATKGLV